MQGLMPELRRRRAAHAVPKLLLWTIMFAATLLAASYLCQARLGRRRRKSYATWLGEDVEKKVEWLHLPKTGTSFGNILIPWACPELPPARRWVNRTGAAPLPDSCRAKFRIDPSSLQRKERSWDIGDHVSLANRTDKELGAVFTMVRSPKTRLVSGYQFLAKFPYLWPRFPPDATPAPGVNATEAEICVHARASFMPHSAIGAQTRIIAGEAMTLNHTGKDWWQFFASPPAAPGAAAGAQVREACRRLRLFAFVGITEEWKASVCLFHAMLGGSIRGSELANTRKGDYLKDEEALREVDCGDSADEQLYGCALVLFMERLARYGRCAQFLKGAAAAGDGGSGGAPEGGCTGGVDAEGDGGCNLMLGAVNVARRSRR